MVHSKAKGFLAEFKAFIDRGNVLDLAVAVVIGGAFGKIVASFVADVFTPILGLFLGGVSFTGLKLRIGGTDAEPNLLNYGNFLQAVFDFLIIAFAIFLLIKALSSFQRKKEEAPAIAPPPPADVVLLTEIRDILKSK